MKWIGQHIYDQVSRFRDHTYFEDSITLSTGKSITMDEYTSGTISITKIQDSGTSFNDSDTSLMTAAAIADKIEAYGYSTTAGDITGIALTAGTGVDLTSVSGATGGNYEAAIAVDVSDFMTNGADNYIVTATGADAMNAEANLTFDGTDMRIASTGKVEFRDGYSYVYSNDSNDLEIVATDITLDATSNIILEGPTLTCDARSIVFTNGSASSPSFTIANTANDTTGAYITLQKDKGAAGADGDDIGTILFKGDNAAQQLTNFASIIAEISEADDTDEAGKLTLNVAESDGSTSALSPGLILEGEHATDGQVDVTIANGAASTTTIAGTLTMGSTAAMTNAGLLSVANQTGITGVGTISSGVWEGTAIATDQQKHKTSFELSGYTTADGTNYDYSGIMSGNKAAFLHDISIGSDGLTADNPAAFLRAAGTVMPYGGTLKIWKGWAASAGSGTIDIGIFKYTPTADDATNASLVLVKNTQFTAAGNDNLIAISETSFSVTVAAGDILITGMKGSTNNKTAYFTSTVEIEWS